MHMARSPTHGARQAQRPPEVGVRSRSFVPPPSQQGPIQKSQMVPDPNSPLPYPPRPATVQSLNSELLHRTSPTVMGANAPLPAGTMRSLPPNLLQGHSLEESQAQRRQVPVSVEVVSGTGPGLGLGQTQRSASLVASAVPPNRPVYYPPHCPHRVPTLNGVDHIDPMTVYNILRDRQGILIDLRGDDRAAGLIEGSIHVPAIGPQQTSFFGRLNQLVRQWSDQNLVIFTCQYSAHRAPQCANWYRQHAHPQQRVAILSGGFRGWEAMGLPVQSAARGEAAQQADDLALRLGQQFVQAAGNSPRSNANQPALQPMPTGSLAASSIPGRPVYVPPHCPNRVPTAQNVEHLEPAIVFNLLKDHQALLVDLRGEDRASGTIDGSVHEPAIDAVPFPSKVPHLVQQWAGHPLVVFTCQYSAHRAPQCANWYRQRAPAQQRVAILSGGFRGWEAQGLPVKSLASAEVGQAADEVAMHLGTQFVQNLPQAQSQSQPWDAGSRSSHAAAGSPTSKEAANGHAPVATRAAPGSTQPSAMRGPVTSKPHAYVAPHLPDTVPTTANVEHIEPDVVHGLMKDNKCLLIDLRGEDRAAGLIDGSVHEPAIDAVPFPTRVPKLAMQWKDSPFVVFTCQYSAHRAPQCANWYREQAPPQQRVGILSGGFRKWEALGLPVSSLARGKDAKAADEVALRLGTRFVDGCITNVPGGGFCLPPRKVVSGDQARRHEPASPLPRQVAVGGSTGTSVSTTTSPVPAATLPYAPHVVPTIENVENIDPKTVHELLKRRKCLLVDLRGEDRKAGLIDGSIHEPAIDSVPFATKIPKLVQKWSDQSLVVFTCQYSAHRAPQCANWYREATHPRQRVGILAGGFRGWEALGLPVQQQATGDESQAADEVAVRLGAEFTDGCVSNVPGGGFCMPLPQ